jgi:hypothetical protein
MIKLKLLPLVTSLLILFLINTRLCAQPLVNPNANEEAIKLKALLDSIYGKKIIAGQMDDSYLNYIVTHSGGKSPAMMGYDFDGICPSQIHKHNIDAQKAIRWVKDKGGIANFSWHWISPNADGDYYTDNFNLAAALADTTGQSYKNLIRDMDLAAKELKILQDSAVAVLWRPLHEAEGRWFWWGKSGGAACIKLYRIMYDRFTNYHNLNNLIWVWTSYGTTRENWYPGDDVVDMIVYDYPDYNNNTGSWAQYQQLFGGKEKLFGIGENGTLPDPEIFTDQPWLYFLTWAYMINLPGQNNGQNTREWIFAVYNDSRVLTLSDLQPGPKAYAGHYQVLYDSEQSGSVEVNLDGSESFATEGTIHAYKWTLNGTEIATGSNPTVTLAPGVHRIRLTITTSLNEQASAWVMVTVIQPSRAWKKPVRVSSTEANLGNIASNAVDGDFGTRWSSIYSDPQWYEIDLLTPHDITNVKIFWQRASARDYRIEQSNDRINWTTVVTKTNMAAGDSRTDNLTGLKGGARYIRMYGTRRTTQWGYSIFEFEVWGTPNPAAEPVPESTTDVLTPESPKIQVFPSNISPDEYLQVNFHTNQQGRIIMVFDLSGKLIKRIPAMEKTNRIRIDNAFSSGLYLLRAIDTNAVMSEKFMVR